MGSRDIRNKESKKPKKDAKKKLPAITSEIITPQPVEVEVVKKRRKREEEEEE